jgi:hypothetical protein
MPVLILVLIGASSFTGICSLLYLVLLVMHEIYRELLQHIVAISNSNYLAGKSDQERRKALSSWAIRVSQRVVGGMAAIGITTTISALITYLGR